MQTLANASVRIVVQQSTEAIASLPTTMLPVARFDVSQDSGLLNFYYREAA